MTEPMPERRPLPTEVLVEMARLKGLSDGVVAFALTLLVLDIRIPEGVAPSDLPANLAELAPSAVVYLIAFAIVGGAWGSHQRMLGQIGRGDGLLVWYTLLSLLPITLLPASASLLGDYRRSRSRWASSPRTSSPSSSALPCCGGTPRATG
jgi:uncharacterized membrane protein